VSPSTAQTHQVSTNKEIESILWKGKGRTYAPLTGHSGLAVYSTPFSSLGCSHKHSGLSCECPLNGDCEIAATVLSRLNFELASLSHRGTVFSPKLLTEPNQYQELEFLFDPVLSPPPLFF